MGVVWEATVTALKVDKISREKVWREKHEKGVN